MPKKEEVDRIVVHYGDGRTATVRPSEKAIRAIFLNGFGRDVATINDKEVAVGSSAMPPGVRVNKADGVAPRGVCYLTEEGVMECWGKD